MLHYVGTVLTLLNRSIQTLPASASTSILGKATRIRAEVHLCYVRGQRFRGHSGNLSACCLTRDTSSAHA